MIRGAISPESSSVRQQDKGVVDVLAALCFLLLAACFMDYRKKKIPNFLIAAIALLGMALRILQDGAGGAAVYIGQAVMVICLFYFLFRLGTVGAGDVKLFGVTAGCLPFKKILLFLFVSLLIAAIISLVKIWKKKYFWERLRYLTGYLSDVWKSGNWKLYSESSMAEADVGICLSGPILVSLLLYLGGAY